MNKQSLKSQVAKGAIWTLLEKLSSQIVTFVVGMILARLLTPDDYGTVALLAIFFAVSGVLVDGGFGNALIQKKDADELDFNSVFYLNVGLSLVAYVVLFLAAPWISRFYNAPILVSIVRVSSINLLFNAVNAVQNAELTRKMLFHLSFRVTMITTLVSAVFGVTLAFLGYGVWALVWSTLASGFAGVVARWFIIAWRPRFVFSTARLKPLFSFGWKMAASALIDQVFVNLNGLLIGKFYSKADLAYVGKGQALPRLAMNEVDATLGRVSFPALVQLQGDRDALRSAMRKMIQCSTFLVFPLMTGIALCSKSIIRLLYGQQWIPSAPYMALACFSFALWPFHTINLRAITAIGRSDIFLRLEIVKKIAKLIVILSAFRHGVFVFMAVSAFALGPLSVLINAWPNMRLLGYSIGMQVMDVLPTALICLVEAVVVLVVEYVSEHAKSSMGVSDSGVGLMVFLGLKLFVQFVLAAGVFVGISYAFRLQPMGEYVRMGAAAIKFRFPRLANALERRFA